MTSRTKAFDAATRGDAAIDRQFCDASADVEDVRMRYVTGGSGPPLVLLAGRPQSRCDWRDVMPALAGQSTAYASHRPLAENPAFITAELPAVLDV